MGLYPGPVLRRMEPATRHYLEVLVNPGAGGAVAQTVVDVTGGDR
jgi:hypothetical protein